jgi:DNA polymerase-3 subunit beta
MTAKLKVVTDEAAATPDDDDEAGVRFEVNLDEIKSALAATTAVTPARPMPPIYGGIQITAEVGEGLELTAVSYEMTARVKVPARVEVPGTVVVPGRFFGSIIKELPAGHPMFAELDGPLVHVTCGKSRYNFPTLPADEFPRTPDLPPVLGTVTADAFAEALPILLKCVSDDTTLPALMCVLFEVGDGEITMVATDRYRLAIRTVPIIRDHDTEVPAFLVYGPMLEALTRSVIGGGDKLTLAVNPGEDVPMLGFTDGRRQVTGRAVQGKYVDWRKQVQPAEWSALAGTEALAAAVRRVQLAGEPKDSVLVTFHDGRITVTAGREDGASGLEEVDAVQYDGPDGLERRFKPGYLLDGLGGVRADRIRFGICADPANASRLKPVVMTAAAGGETPEAPAGDAPAFQYVLMPVKPART